MPEIGALAPSVPHAVAARLVVSIVSHGHGEQVQLLLEQMAQCRTLQAARVVVTHNIPEPPLQVPPGGWSFALETSCNAAPQGFGANHNQTLRSAMEPFVCVLNPDVRLLPGEDVFAALVQAAGQQGVGCAYPGQVDGRGKEQDSERELPTPWALWRRRVLRQPDIGVDWVNAACLVLPQPVWQALGGFDESYFMYCEDVDLCLRIRLAGLALVRAPVQVVHAGQRASHRRWSHLQWHVRSLFRLWRSPVYRKARQLLSPARQGTGTIGAS